MRPFSGKWDDCFQIDDHLNTPVFMRKWSSGTEFIRRDRGWWIEHCSEVAYSSFGDVSICMHFNNSRIDLKLVCLSVQFCVLGITVL